MFRKAIQTVQTLGFIALLTLFAIPASAVDGFNPDKPLNYGLHWFRLDPNNNPNCGQAVDPDGGNAPVYYECIDAVRFNGASGRWEEDTLTQFGDDPYYDPQKPTIIYFHGWQPGGGDTRENFGWQEGDSAPWDTLKTWRDRGWNVGLFYWNQFADTPYLVGRAEGKIWSSNTNFRMQYRYNDGDGLNKHPSPQDLGLPIFSRAQHPSVQWDNLSHISQALSAVKFIHNRDPATAESEVHRIYRDLESSTCEEMVEQETCGAGASPLCTNSNDWREVFLTKVCQTPSVGDLAFENLNIALADQGDFPVIFSGHSLGHQLATRTATHLWMAYSHYQARGTANQQIASNRLDALPKRLELFDPYASTLAQPHLSPYTFDGNGLGNWFQRRKNRKTNQHIFNYVKRLKQLTAQEGINLPVSYYHSSILGSLPLSTTNPGLIRESAYQRHRFDYVGRLDFSFKHAGSRFWYFKSIDEGNTYPPLSNTSSGLTWQQGLSAWSTDMHVRQAMAESGANGVSFRQVQGMKNRPLAQAVFRATDLASMEWPGDVDMSDVDEAQTAVERRLFNNSLTITSDNTIDAVYVNGENLTGQLSSAGSWWQADTISNLDLHNGHNVIAIKATDAGGVAALLAELEIDGSVLVTNRDWRVTRTTPAADWMETDFDDSDWESATIHGDYGDAPWGTGVSGLSADSPASWIWSSDDSLHNTVYFRYVIPASGPWKVRMVPVDYVPLTSLSTAISLVDELRRSDFLDGDDDESLVADALNFSTAGSQGHYADDTAFPLPLRSSAVSYAFEALGTIDIETEGHYTFGFHVNGGARIKIERDGSDVVIATVDSSSGPVTELGSVYLAPGQYEIEIVAYGDKADGALEVFAAKGVRSSWDADDFTLLLPNDQLDRINLNEEPDVCHLASAGLRTGQFTGITHTPQSVSYTLPYQAGFLPQMQTFNGTDTADVGSLAGTSSGFVNIVEENSLEGAGGELIHIAETVGWIGTSSQTGNELLRDAGNHIVGWAPGPRSVTESFTTIQLPRTFVNPVVIGYVKNASQPVHIRLFNVGPDSFQAKIERWQGHPYPSGAITGNMVFFVVEAGIHYMRGGQVLQVGLQDVRQTTRNATQQVTFPVAFDEKPIVLSMSQTVVDPTPIVTRNRAANTTGFQVAVQEEEGNNGTHLKETIGWVAVTGNSDIIRFDNCP